jgi:hypothetical protein
MSEFQEYPKWVYFPEPAEVYAPGSEPVLVQSAKEERKLKKSVPDPIEPVAEVPAE